MNEFLDKILEDKPGHASRKSSELVLNELAKGIPELVGGSAREDDLAKLDARLDALKLDKNDYWWYRDLRKYGSVPHAGFGLGFERLVMMATGIDNIRDSIPFPRAPGQAEF